MEENISERTKSFRKLYLPKIKSNITQNEQSDRNPLVSYKINNIRIIDRIKKSFKNNT